MLFLILMNTSLSGLNLIVVPVNGSHLYEGGVTLDALKYAVELAFTWYGTEKGKIGKNDKIKYRKQLSLKWKLAFTVNKLLRLVSRSHTTTKTLDHLTTHLS